MSGTPIDEIAERHLGIETLEEQRSDSLDFHTVSVWDVRAALHAAFEAGRDSVFSDATRRARAAERAADQ